MTGGEKQSKSWCYKTLEKLKNERLAWDSPDVIDRALDPRIFELPAVSMHISEDSAPGRVTGLARAVDAAIRRLSKADAEAIDADPESDRAKRPFGLAAAVVIRRPGLVSKQFLKDVRDNKHYPDDILAARLTTRQDALTRHAWDVTFRNHQHEVLAALESEINPSSNVAPSARPSLPIDKYRPADPVELADWGFWWRKSTQDYIDWLAKDPPDAIYAGADGWSDIGEPLHSRLARLFLTSRLRMDRLVAGLDDHADLVEAVASVFDRRSPSFIGSIVRGLAANLDVRRPVLEDGLAKIARDLVMPDDDDRSRKHHAFVGRRVAGLAQQIALTKPVRIVSAHNDNDIADELGDLDPSVPITLDKLHPLVNRDAFLISQAVLSESDLFEEPAPEGEGTWAEYLRELLADSSALFVGTDIRSPGLIAALAQTRRRGHRRFAILRAPEVPPWQIDQPTEQSKDNLRSKHAGMAQALYLRALSGRYLDLGVTPIWVDFQYQAHQFIREIQLQIEQGSAYKHHYERCDRWWQVFAPAFGFPNASGVMRLAPSRDEWQSEWHSRLLKLRTDTEKLIENSTKNSSETLLIEAWIRNPLQREMFLWATSDHLILRSETAFRAPLHDQDGIVQDAFRTGETTFTDDLKRPPWQFAVLIPLVLRHRPYYGLPIGVIRVLSTEAKGELRTMEQNPFALDIEEKVGEAMSALFPEAGEGNP